MRRREFLGLLSWGAALWETLKFTGHPIVGQFQPPAISTRLSARQ
jgi:hypothetical protein